jgi:hypothetical protein
VNFFGGVLITCSVFSTGIRRVSFGQCEGGLHVFLRA